MGYMAVTNALNRAGVMRSIKEACRLASVHSEDDIRVCLVLYKAGYSSGDVSRVTGIPEPTIRHWVRNRSTSRSTKKAARLREETGQLEFGIGATS